MSAENAENAAPPQPAPALPPAAYAPPPPPGYAPAPPAYAAYVPQAKSPALAGVLSAMPGLGHIYLGLYQRAATFFAVWMLIIAVVQETDSGAIGFGIPFWWFFVLIDAVRQAKAINATGLPESNIAISEGNFKPTGSLFLGVFLILVGGFLFLRRFVDINLRWLVEYWPVLLIAFGAWGLHLLQGEPEKEDETTTNY
jgi:hypothetical protein